MNRTFRRLTDDGHITMFSAYMSTGQVVISLRHRYMHSKVITTLSKEDAKRLIEWLIEKTK